MRKYGLLIFNALILACNEQEAQDVININMPYAFPISKEPAFAPYFASFDAYYGTNSSKVGSRFTKLKDAVGVCYIYSNGFKKIEIDSNFWNNAIDNEKHNLIYHELGHCLLGKEHNDNIIPIYYGRLLIKEYIQESIMNSYNFGNTWYYEIYKDYYLEQLKTN